MTKSIVGWLGCLGCLGVSLTQATQVTQFTQATAWGDPDLTGRWPLTNLNGTPVHERFTRVDDDTIDYEMTVEDPVVST